MLVKSLGATEVNTITNFANKKPKKNVGITYIHDPNFGARNMVARKAKTMTTAIAIMPYVLRRVGN